MPEIIITNNQSHFIPVALIDKDGLVVLFTGKSAGTVIQSDGSYPVGHFNSSWNMKSYMEWKKFQGTILLNFA